METSLGLLIRFALGTMFLSAGASKLSDLGEFADAIKLYKIIPGVTAGAVAKMVAVTEVVLGTVLLVGLGIPYAGGARVGPAGGLCRGHGRQPSEGQADSLRLQAGVGADPDQAHPAQRGERRGAAVPCELAGPSMGN